MHSQIGTEIVGVDFEGLGVSDEDIANLVHLPRVRFLNLKRTLITDAALQHVVRLRLLLCLDLSETAVTDASLPCLRSCKELRVLTLRGTVVTNEAIIKLNEELPKCDVYR